MKKAGGKAIRYNFDREHVVLIANASNGNFTASLNPITDKNGKIVTIGKTNYDGNGESLHSLRFDTANTNYVEITTKDHPLDDPARQKSLKKVYLNYKINSTDVPTIKYKKDNGTAKDFDVAIANTSDAFTTLALKPNVSSEANNGRSFQILLYGAIHSSFVLNATLMVWGS